MDGLSMTIAHQETPSPSTPYGTKGAGEGGRMLTPAVLSAAIEDALEPYGVHITSLPISAEPRRVGVFALNGQRATSFDPCCRAGCEARRPSPASPGVALIPASSGKIVRHRLDRGGDRRLNRALHTIVLSLRRTDPRTHAYVARRVCEGKSERDATRCLKRYLARSLFRQLEAMSRA